MELRISEHDGSHVHTSTGVGLYEQRPRLARVGAALLETLGTPPSRPTDAPARKRHPGRGRRVRFVCWVALVVVVVCLLGAIASPAKTTKKHHSAASAATVVAAPAASAGAGMR